MVVRVVRGAPDDVELAALVTALALLAAGAPPAPAVEVGGWRARGTGEPLFRRPGAWRLSGLPR
ncbi:acyl-CoA carboxylase epsilon subunit [Amycolatopsis sp. SID8362]|uniref:acyl-CoA carboxylase epsilon subunit n=1 Tax=Amycolatopsis sp. SID8362 TaxID=2690346 RepID=UPI001368B4E1|nr:acyl-CoA carboxylase epsilon subunit [Amycolatopsis sp. SID8362]NBH02745.1 acyl-CoA carboxylase subunit epsilon [Amycolatopsis sp. SID8362]NED39447.1 acyl-CoA carboxylase subunit epsilon [Amycolatopsis sp. SID8362]